MAARALMFQGTGSDVGKSLLVAGLARALTRRGLAVRPFKPQNMSNNAAVTPDGGEIGRAQWLQARAARVAPSVDMNPVLLKPETDRRAQVVVRGQVWRAAGAADYQHLKRELLGVVLQSFATLRAECDLVLVEGAGSPAEINLRANDIANMGFALEAAVPVVLVGDIDRGGVIAALVGTWALLEPAEKALVRGFVINKFRGDVRLFDGGLSAITTRTGWPSFGVVPWIDAARQLPAEDAVTLDRPLARANGTIRVAVPRLSRIANFDDLDPLQAEPDVVVDWVAPGQPLPAAADLVVLPGSKATLGDLRFFRAQGWDIDLQAHVRRGGRVLGLCGGYQMLGQSVADPAGIEGAAGTEPGLGLLNVETTLEGNKTLTEVHAAAVGDGAEVRGYEMHLGVTQGPDCARPMFRIGARGEGASSADGRITGTYLHGLFAADGFRAAYLAQLRHGRTGGVAYEAGVDAALDRLAEALERHLAIDALLAAAA